MNLDVDMSTEVFETPDPEVTFQAYAPVGGAHRTMRATSVAPEDAHFFDKASANEEKREQTTSLLWETD